MKLKYIGTGELGDNTEVTVYGLTFVQGEAVEVADATVAKKLAGNPTFEVVVSGRRGSAE